MFKIIKTIIFIVICSQVAFSQTIVSNGGEGTGSDGDFSYSIGQVFYTYFAQPKGDISEGIQYPYKKRELLGVTPLANEQLLDPKNSFNSSLTGWMIEKIEEFPETKIQIFNAWGNEVWKTDAYSNNGEEDKQWFGTNLLGSEVDEGVYFYIMSFKDSSIENKSGWVYLLR